MKTIRNQNTGITATLVKPSRGGWGMIVSSIGGGVQKLRRKGFWKAWAIIPALAFLCGCATPRPNLQQEYFNQVPAAKDHIRY